MRVEIIAIALTCGIAGMAVLYGRAYRRTSVAHFLFVSVGFALLGAYCLVLTVELMMEKSPAGSPLVMAALIALFSIGCFSLAMGLWHALRHRDQVLSMYANRKVWIGRTGPSGRDVLRGRPAPEVTGRCGPPSGEDSG
jgi:hypothetical protein